MRPPRGGARAWSRVARVAGAVTAGAILAATIATSATAAVAAGDEDDSPGRVTVEVTDGSTNPSPSPTRGNRPPVKPPFVPPRSPVRTPTVVASDVTQAIIPDPAGADEALGDDPVTTGGVLAMSGLSASVSPSLEPGNGSVTLDVVVRNTSRSAFDSTARFWVDNIAGGRVVEVDDVRVDALEPNETRRVAVTIEGLGQNAVLRTYMTFTPPETVDGVRLSPLSRNKTVVVAPLFTVSLASLALAVGGLAWWAVSPRGAGLRRLWWGA